MKEALGLIETIGMAAAIEAADTCVKSANVELIGYELTRGQGMVTVKIKGDVGAVKAAVESAKVSSAKVNKVVSTLVIPRPAQGIQGIISSDSTVGIEREEDNKKQALKDNKEVEIVKEEAKQDEKNKEKTVTEQKETLNIQKKTEKEEVEKKEEIVESKENIKQQELKEDSETCNICHDAACPRRKGQPKNMCIHYNEMQGDINGRD
ncbi:BMC domain-containing protein [Clostridium drakei]|uniref:Ethanolamine utilization protein n=1 Tax=Clostridium drakei TaxID=332101 RepID=A0A2U8DW37_9CLOT|nr:BMC domain-containing protein [Clostridium drakei]AWI06464.1 ethanolamine utilization protein [Clostridium drakei]